MDAVEQPEVQEQTGAGPTGQHHHHATAASTTSVLLRMLKAASQQASALRADVHTLRRATAEEQVRNAWC